ncbi:hypothetical protein [Novosphingobium kunmingense]|uniref:hypothetical protein n=1 Tax=Novosphingobium kunmingense TaxID=1211806 RepID=UPI0012FD53B2|nr:hypothetical protein [Novosphingobium kunmingense]
MSGTLPQFADPAQLAAAFERLAPGASLVWATGPSSLGTARNATRALVDTWIAEKRATCAHGREPGQSDRWLFRVYRTEPGPFRRNGISATGKAGRDKREDQNRVLGLLADCARRGTECPTNEAIAEALDLPTPWRARYLVQRLEAEGEIRLIEPARFGPRVIEIASSGLRTASVETAR